jgi:CBS-domain-containing membrane protein
MEARDVMTAPVITVSPGTSVEQVAKLMIERRISAIPVVDPDGRLQGIVSEGDLMRHSRGGVEPRRSWWLSAFSDRDALAKEYTKSNALTAADVMTSKVVTSTESTPLEKIATLLERHRIKRVPILRRGKVVGVVSRANLLHGLVAQKAPPPKTVVKDRDIRTRILGELEAAGVDKAYINVVVANGVVELWGLVEAESQKRAVAIAVKGTKGVKRVVDNVITVSPAMRSAMGSGLT